MERILILSGKSSALSMMQLLSTRRGTFGSCVTLSEKPFGKRCFTKDDAAMPRAQFFTTEKLGPKQALTPEGFLVVYDVPIARTGEMIYGPGEIPLEPGPDGIIHVTRDADEVFRPEFIASFCGKPIVDEHPEDAVVPLNWRDLTVGTVLNPRRAVAPNDDLLIVDFIIYDQAAIREVQNGKREVSCGYDAEYESTGPGRGRQKDMIGNHVALVESGRCGPRCAIGDRKPSSTGDTMTHDKKLGWLDKLFAGIQAAFGAKDEKALKLALDEARAEAEKEIAKDEGGEALHLHLGGGTGGNEAMDALNERMTALETGHSGIMDALEEIKGKFPKEKEEPTPDAEAVKEIEGQLEEEAPVGTGDAAKKAKDSAYLGDSFQEAVALAEVLVPGIQVPTYDSKLAPAKTLDAICKLRRTALDLAYATPDGRAAIESVNGGKRLALDGMKCRDVRSIFRSAAAVRKATNNISAPARDKVGGVDVTKPVHTQADLNKRMAEFYKS